MPSRHIVFRPSAEPGDAAQALAARFEAIRQEFDLPDGFPADRLTSYLPSDAPAALYMTLLRGAFRHAASLVAAHASQLERSVRHRELAELTRVGAALSTGSIWPPPRRVRRSVPSASNCTRPPTRSRRWPIPPAGPRPPTRSSPVA